MARNQRSREGYLLIDHSASPGIGSIPEGKIYETATRTCCGCNRVIVLRPDRSRERHYCRQHDSYLCDDCSLVFATTGVHKSILQLFDELEALILKGQTMESALTLTNTRT